MNYLLIPTYLFVVIFAFYALWVLYLAIMNLKRVRDLGLLHSRAKALGIPVLVVGYILDFLLNKICMSFVLLELPQELTISARLKRHNRVYATGLLARWRKAVAVWFEPLLDPFDPSGDHI